MKIDPRSNSYKSLFLTTQKHNNYYVKVIIHYNKHGYIYGVWFKQYILKRNIMLCLKVLKSECQWGSGSLRDVETCGLIDFQ